MAGVGSVGAGTGWEDVGACDTVSLTDLRTRKVISCRRGAWCSSVRTSRPVTRRKLGPPRVPCTLEAVGGDARATKERVQGDGRTYLFSNVRRCWSIIDRCPCFILNGVSPLTHQRYLQCGSFR